MNNFEMDEGIPIGLTSEKAEELKREGKANVVNEKAGKSYLRIISDNLFTFSTSYGLLSLQFLSYTAALRT